MVRTRNRKDIGYSQVPGKEGRHGPPSRAVTAVMRSGIQLTDSSESDDESNTTFVSNKFTQRSLSQTSSIDDPPANDEEVSVNQDNEAESEDTVEITAAFGREAYVRAMIGGAPMNALEEAESLLQNKVKTEGQVELRLQRRLETEPETAEAVDEYHQRHGRPSNSYEEYHSQTSTQTSKTSNPSPPAEQPPAVPNRRQVVNPYTNKVVVRRPLAAPPNTRRPPPPPPPRAGRKPPPPPPPQQQRKKAPPPPPPLPQQQQPDQWTLTEKNHH